MIEIIENYLTGYITFVPEVYVPYVLSVILFVLLSAFFRALQWAVLARLEVLSKKTKTDIDDTFIKITKSIKPGFYYFFSFWFVVQTLEFPALVNQIINGILIAWIAYQIVISIHILIDYWLERRARKEKGEGRNAYRFLSNIAKWVLWVVAVLMVLSNLGVNVTSLIAGLGIGGIAVALAAQNVLGDLFSSFAIYFDKPFEVGDFITVGPHSGTVEKIGIKTTRIRALQGEEIVVSNQELTSSRIQNIRKMKERRVAFPFGILYETSEDKVRAVPGIVREIFSTIHEEGLKLDRVFFTTFGDSALTYEVVYFLPTRDIEVYLRTQQEINFKLLERFNREKIGFAYPTQTIYLAKD